MTEQQYINAVTRIDWLMNHQDELDQDEENELEALAIMIDEYEHDHFNF